MAAVEGRHEMVCGRGRERARERAREGERRERVGIGWLKPTGTHDGYGVGVSQQIQHCTLPVPPHGKTCRFTHTHGQPYLHHPSHMCAAASCHLSHAQGNNLYHIM